MNEKSIGRLVALLYRSGLNYTVKEFKPYGIGSGQFVFLAELFAQDGISQEELALSIRCDKATVARAMHQLERHGYVERKRSADDGRVKLVYLTDKALNFKPILFSILSNWTEIITQGLSSEERKVIGNLTWLLFTSGPSILMATSHWEATKHQGTLDQQYPFMFHSTISLIRLKLLLLSTLKQCIRVIGGC